METTTKETTMSTDTTTGITSEQIEALRIEAGTAGDMEQVRICEMAQECDADAQAECARVIADSRNQSE